MIGYIEATVLNFRSRLERKKFDKKDRNSYVNNEFMFTLINSSYVSSILL